MTHKAQTEILGHATFFPEKEADSHAGQHGDFAVHWSDGIDNGVEFLFGFEIAGWYYISNDADPVGPFETSQAAFGAYVDAVDAEIRAGKALS